MVIAVFYTKINIVEKIILICFNYHKPIENTTKRKWEPNHRKSGVSLKDIRKPFSLLTIVLFYPILHELIPLNFIYKPKTH